MDRAEEYANGDQGFADWLRKVDAAVMARVGVGVFDLPDFLLRDEYDFGTDPVEAAEMAIEEAY